MTWLTTALGHPSGQPRPLQTSNSHDLFAGLRVAGARIAATSAENAIPMITKKVRPEVISCFRQREAKQLEKLTTSESGKQTNEYLAPTSLTRLNRRKHANIGHGSDSRQRREHSYRDNSRSLDNGRRQSDNRRNAEQPLSYFQ
jgi:hypothetical protein